MEAAGSIFHVSAEDTVIAQGSFYDGRSSLQEEEGMRPQPSTAV